MKSKFILALLLIFTINLMPDDVLDETVYWELTRVDTKIEEKKFDEAEQMLEHFGGEIKSWRDHTTQLAFQIMHCGICRSLSKLEEEAA